ncbi:MAG: hypothetical protein Q8O93_05910 [bacterium]|nr:hypothetical protein [bacterium]
MKTMKSLLVAVVVLFAVSCSEKPAPVDEPAQTVFHEKIEAKADEKVATVKEAEEKRESIENVKVAFGLENPPEQMPAWVEEVKSGENTKLFVETCRGYRKFYNMSQFVHSGDIDWKKVGIYEQEAAKLFRQTGLETARLLVKIFNLSIGERHEGGSCYMGGEGNFYYFEGGRVMENIIWILNKLKANPDDIGLTSISMRQSMLNDFKRQILYWRNQIATMQASQSDGGAILIWTIKEALAWNFTPEQLGLKKEEIKEAKEDGQMRDVLAR